MPKTNYNSKSDLEHEKDLQRIQKLHLMDDDFMSVVFEDKACSQFLLQTILNRNDLIIKDVKTQHNFKNLHGHSICLDIYARSISGEEYDIEIQRADKGACPRRARYNSSILDANILSPGDDYQNLRETYVIFITEKDILGYNKPIYHIDRMVREIDMPFNDDSHIIYVNGELKNEDTDLSRLMHDFSCSNIANINSPILKDRIKYFKEEEKGVASMCRILEEMREETAKEVAKEVAKETTINNAVVFIGNLLSEGFSLEKALILANVPNDYKGAVIQQVMNR